MQKAMFPFCTNCVPTMLVNYLEQFSLEWQRYFTFALIWICKLLCAL